MTGWYLTGVAQKGMGAQSSKRRAAERLVGARAAASLARRATIAGAIARARLTPLGRRSTRALDGMHDAYRGQRCVIVGNGPSLKRTNLELLAGEHTFGLNRLYLLFEELGFGTEFHIVVNREVVKQVHSELVGVPGRLISTWANRHDLSSRDDAIFLHSVVGPLFSMDARRGVWEGATVTYVAMQLAYFMGFSDVLLIGVDHRFSTTGPAHSLVTSQGRDQDHFDPNYFGRGFRWQLARPDDVRVGIRSCTARLRGRWTSHH